MDAVFMIYGSEVLALFFMQLKRVGYKVWEFSKQINFNNFRKLTRI